MKNICIAVTLLFFSIQLGMAQDVTGKWKTIDDNTGVAKSIVHIYKENGKVYGKVIEIFNKDRRDAKCTNCTGNDANKPVLGMVIIRDLEKDGDEYDDGKILDPESGKLYDCYIELEKPDTLKVRGYLGIAMLGRTQYWERVP